MVVTLITAVASANEARSYRKQPLLRRYRPQALATSPSSLVRFGRRIVQPMAEINWTCTGKRLDARSPSQGGPFASVIDEGGTWSVVWWVGPKSRTVVPSQAKGRAWIERFSGRRLESLGREAATPGTGPGGPGGYAPPTPEEQARYDAFGATYVPPRRSRKRSR